MKELTLELSQDLVSWTKIANETFRLKFVFNGIEIQPKYIKNLHFCTPSITEYYFDKFVIQEEYDYLSESFNVRKYLI